MSIIGGSCHKYNLCRDRHVFVATKHVFCYHWRELPQVSFLSRQNTSFVTIGGSCHKYHFCRDKTRLLLPLAGAATSIIFVATKHVFCYHWRELPQVSFLSRQNTSFVTIGGSCHKYRFCRDKTRLLLPLAGAATSIIFVATKHVFCYHWRELPQVSFLSRQNI